MNAYTKVAFLYIIAVNLFFTGIAVNYDSIALLVLTTIGFAAAVYFARQTDDTPTISEL